MKLPLLITKLISKFRTQNFAIAYKRKNRKTKISLTADIARCMKDKFIYDIIRYYRSLKWNSRTS